MKHGLYRNPQGDEIEIQYQAMTAREFLIVGTVYCAIDPNAKSTMRDRLVTAEGLRKGGYKLVES